jgi:cell division protein FtsZ
LTDDLEERVEMSDAKPKAVLSPEEQALKAKDRMDRIQSYTSKLKSAEGIDDLEKEPAYKRKKIEFDDVPHSSEESMSKFTLSDEGEENGERKIELKQNNSFLHDNVD